MKRIAILLLLALTACGSDGIERRVGYFKDGVGNRILTFELSADADSNNVWAHADALQYTKGQMLAAYYYPHGSQMIPADGVTLAKSVFDVNGVLYDTPGLGRWRYVFMRPLSGPVEFIDCDAKPKDGLCRTATVVDSPKLPPQP